MILRAGAKRGGLVEICGRLTRLLELDGDNGEAELRLTIIRRDHIGSREKPVGGLHVAQIQRGFTGAQQSLNILRTAGEPSQILVQPLHCRSGRKRLDDCTRLRGERQRAADAERSRRHPPHAPSKDAEPRPAETVLIHHEGSYDTL